MKNLLRHMPLVCLLAPCLALSAQSRNPYDLELNRLQARWSAAGVSEKLVLLDRILHLHVYVDDRAAVQQFLETARQSPAETTSIRNEAAASLDDLRAFSLPTQPRAQHWYAAEESRKRVLATAGQAAGPGSAASLEVLAELERLAAAPEAAGHMFQAAQLAPTAARWQRAAEFTDEPLRKFAALESGLAVEPENSRIKLQLAAYYVGRQQLEKARDLLNSAAAAAPDDFLIAERRASLYLNLGLRSAALSELRALEKHWTNAGFERAGAEAPLWLRGRLALDY